MKTKAIRRFSRILDRLPLNAVHTEGSLIRLYRRQYEPGAGAPRRPRGQTDKPGGSTPWFRPMIYSTPPARLRSALSVALGRALKSGRIRKHGSPMGRKYYSKDRSRPARD